MSEIGLFAILSILLASSFLSVRLKRTTPFFILKACNSFLASFDMIQLMNFIDWSYLTEGFWLCLRPLLHTGWKGTDRFHKEPQAQVYPYPLQQAMFPCLWVYMPFLACDSLNLFHTLTCLKIKFHSLWIYTGIFSELEFFFMSSESSPLETKKGRHLCIRIFFSWLPRLTQISWFRLDLTLAQLLWSHYTWHHVCL